MHDVFIAHVEEDADVALEITLGLEEVGYKTWCYEVDSFPGQSYLIQTGRAVEESKVVVVVISPHSLGSRQVTREIIRAHESGREFVPVLRDITHVEFQNRQPEWREAIGAAASISIPRDGAARIIPRIIDGLKSLGIHPRSKTEPARIAQIRTAIGELQPSKITEREKEPRGPIKKEVVSPIKVKKDITKSVWFRAGTAILTIGILTTLVWVFFFSSTQAPETPSSPPAAPETQSSPPAAPETPEAEPPAVSSKLLYEDDFSNPSIDWVQESNEDREMYYKAGEYHIISKYFDSWAASLDSNIGRLSDFSLEIDARPIAMSGESAYGAIFRYQWENAFYCFIITGDGYYYVVKRFNDQWVFLQQRTKSDFIKLGNNTNHLKVVCKGSQIEVYVNGHYLVTVTDDTLNEGYVGMTVSTTAPNGHAAFDSIKVDGID
jgi:hypothetical protein